jgi:hypothetical protein
MKFKVTKSTKSINGGFVNTLEGESTSKVFGVTKTTKHKFLFKTDEEVLVGTEDEITLSDYNQTPFTSEVLDEKGEVVTITSIWLHKKAKDEQSMKAA